MIVTIGLSSPFNRYWCSPSSSYFGHSRLGSLGTTTFTARRSSDLHAAALSLIITSFQSIPAIRLERRLAFDRLAIADVAQALSFNIVAIVLALRGAGAWSFVIAMLVRSTVGAIIIQVVSRWRIGWCLDWPRVKAHMAFGLPFQAIGFISLIKDSITPVLVGVLAGAATVGYISWAQTIAAYSVLALMVFQRVYLPAFARLQSDRAALGLFVERVVWATNAICAPLALLMLALFNPFTTTVFGSKWLVRGPTFCFSGSRTCLAHFNADARPFDALGRAKTAMGFALVWMAGTWLIGAPLIFAFGGIGFAIANFIVQFSNLALFRVAQRLVPFPYSRAHLASLVHCARGWRGRMVRTSTLSSPQSDGIHSLRTCRNWPLFGGARCNRRCSN